MPKHSTLREKVYKYLRKELTRGSLVSGDFVDQNKICQHLGISRAPLRDALIQLETEGFLEIQPRRGVKIRPLSLQDIKDSYDVLGTLEASIVAAAFHRLTPHRLARMESINAALYKALAEKRYKSYYELNIQFHDTFLNLSDNRLIRQIVYPLKQRLYDFPGMNYDHAWEMLNLNEHRRFIESIRAENRDAAVAVIKNEHWGFDWHRPHLIKVYGLAERAA